MNQKDAKLEQKADGTIIAGELYSNSYGSEYTIQDNL